MSLFSKKDSATAIIFDIGTGSIGSALVALSATEKPRIIYAARHPIAFQEKLNPARLPALMIPALERACSDMRKMGIPRLKAEGKNYPQPKRATVALCSPWYLSETRLLAIENIKPFAFTKDILDGALREETDRFEEKENVEKSQSVSLDREALSVRLDGYPAIHPFGKRSTRAEISAYLSFTSKSVEDDVRKTLLKEFSPHEVEFTAFPLLQYKVLCKKTTDEGDFIMIDIGREVTEVSLVKKGIFGESFSFPVGKNHLIREEMKASGTDNAIASSALIMHFKGAGSDEHSSKISKPIVKVSEKWVSAYVEAIEKLSNTHYLPRTAYLLIQPDFEAFFKTLIGRASAHSPTIEEANQEIVSLNAEFFKGDFSTQKDVDVDTFLILTAIYAGMRFSNPDSGL